MGAAFISVAGIGGSASSQRLAAHALSISSSNGGHFRTLSPVYARPWRQSGTPATPRQTHRFLNGASPPSASSAFGADFASRPSAPDLHQRQLFKFGQLAARSARPGCQRRQRGQLANQFNGAAQVADVFRTGQRRHDKVLDFAGQRHRPNPGLPLRHSRAQGIQAGTVSCAACIRASHLDADAGRAAHQAGAHRGLRAGIRPSCAGHGHHADIAAIAQNKTPGISSPRAFCSSALPAGSTTQVSGDAVFQQLGKITAASATSGSQVGSSTKRHHFEPCWRQNRPAHPAEQQ